MYKRILAPVDGSATSRRGLIEAVKLAKKQHATLRLLHVVDELPLVMNLEGGLYVESVIEGLRAEGGKILARSLTQARALGAKAQATLVESLSGRVADVIVKEAKRWHADAIVIGTHGRRGITRLVLGSDAEEVLRASPVPVLLVRTAERKLRAKPRKR